MPTPDDHPGLPVTPHGPVHSVDDLLARIDSLQRQLDQVSDALSRSHRLSTLGTLAACVAHEFNNILTPIESYARLALQRPDQPELTRKALTHAVEGAQRAAAVSASILGFARGEPESACASLHEAVSDALRCLGREPAKDGIEVHVEVGEQAVAMPAHALQQVLVNLTLNACRAMQRRGGRLRITATPSDTWVRLTVDDTGPGIPEAVRERLFEPFVTDAAAPVDAPRPGVSMTPGTGLGLAICKQLVEAAGGTIDAESEPGQGARFVLTLPSASHDAIEASSAQRLRRSA